MLTCVHVHIHAREHVSFALWGVDCGFCGDCFDDVVGGFEDSFGCFFDEFGVGFAPLGDVADTVGAGVES